MNKRFDYMGLLPARQALLNLAALGGVLLDITHGQWLVHMLRADGSYITHGILVLLVTGLLLAFYRGLHIGDAVVRANWAEAGRLGAKVKPLRQLAGVLPVLGMLGTVIGFAVALSGVKPDSVADPSAIAGMVATLMDGMQIAIYTTIVGSISYLWLMVNVWMLEAGVARIKRGS